LAHYASKPNVTHGVVIRYEACYLFGTKEKGIFMCPKPPIELTSYMDANLKKRLFNGPETAKSLSEFILFLASASIFWKSKFQTTTLPFHPLK
jgi:hypothetical protein